MACITTAWSSHGHAQIIEQIIKINKIENKNKNDVLFSNDTGIHVLPITSLDALPLSYRRLEGAKAIKLGSWDKHPAYC